MTGGQEARTSMTAGLVVAVVFLLGILAFLQFRSAPLPVEPTGSGSEEAEGTPAFSDAFDPESDDAARPLISSRTRVSAIHLPPESTDPALPEIRVHGVVVDGSGRPIPGADIWLSELNSTARGDVVTQADEEGRFTLASARHHCLTAKAPGYVLSRPLSLWTVPDQDDLQLEVVLDRGVELEGIVVDARGNPVAGARIALGWHREMGQHLDNDQRSMPKNWLAVPPPLVIHSDETGRFYTPSAPIGDEIPIHALAPGFGITVLNLPVPRPEPLIITLADAVTVRGTVRSPDGTPLDGITVRTQETPDGHPPWNDLTTQTAADGTYELRGLTHWYLLLSVHHQDWGSLETSLPAQPGQTLTWNPVLDPGLVLSGRVVDERGRPRVGWLVQVRSVATRPSSMGRDRQHEENRRTNARGRFRFIHCVSSAYTLSVSDPEVQISSPTVFREEGFRPGAEHTLVVPEQTRPSSFVHVKLVGPDGQPVVGVAAVNGRTLGMVEGERTIGPMRAGRYHFRFSHPTYAPIYIDGRELVHGQRVSLGTLTFGESASVEVAAMDVQGLAIPSEALKVSAFNESDLPGRRREYKASAQNGILLIEQIPPGEYLLSVVAPAHAPVLQPLQTFAGTRSTILVQLQQGHELSFLVGGTDYGDRVELVWKNEKGQTIYEERVQGEGRQRGPLEIQRFFSPGTYRVSVLRYSNQPDAAEVEFQVSADGVSHPPIVLEPKR